MDVLKHCLLPNFITIVCFISLVQLFASVAPLLLLETRIDTNGEESELEDLAGKVSVFLAYLIVVN